jgi:biopolymer transport protein ExbD
MRHRRFELKNTLSHEFELDLAPLLAVMVKLVPVLLVSSAFVSVMMIETDLPQVVKDAIVKQEQQKDGTSVQLQINGKTGIQIIVEKSGNQNIEAVPLKNDGSFDYGSLHEKLVNVKKAHPEVFRLELAPEGNIAYKEIVKIMDEARKARNNKIVFPVLDTKTGKEVDTNYMFPDVVFANVLEG